MVVDMWITPVDSAPYRRVEGMRPPQEIAQQEREPGTVPGGEADAIKQL